MKHNAIEHPPHYCTHPSGIEAIHVSSRMNFVLGNAFKHLFRCSSKGRTLEDLNKALWYLKYELSNRQGNWLTRVGWAITWSDYFEHNADVEQVLAYETRYCGHMSSALDAICVAGMLHGGPCSVRRAIKSVEKMVRIEEDKLP